MDFRKFFSFLLEKESISSVKKITVETDEWIYTFNNGIIFVGLKEEEEKKSKGNDIRASF